MSRSKRSRFQPSLEQLELRLVPAGVCDANPTYQAECNYLDNLIPHSALTITAVQPGNWSNPATWGGRTPQTGDNVWIPNGIAVTVDGQETGALRSILDNGVLTFAPNANTSLLVNTLVVGTDNNPTGQPEGELDIGTAANPIQAGVTADLIFADAASCSPGMTQGQLFLSDTESLSGGLISMGTLNIYGSEVTPYVDLAGNVLSAGSTGLSLSSVPVGWNVGDTLLIPGTDAGQVHDEQIQIAAIQTNTDGTATVTFAAPLQYTHSAPAGQSVQVADENRNVVIEDQGTATQYQDGSDGQVMEMHNDAAAIEYAAFLDPGRTDKSVPLGSALPNGTVNHVGRYALHFHRDYWPSINGNDPPIQVVGCFQAGGVGWGYDNHSSNVDFINDVAYDDFGAGFVNEAGNELGEFDGCLSINTPGVPNTALNPALRQSSNDFGWGGFGFWSQGDAQTAFVDNHVWEAQVGYGIFGLGLVQHGLGATKAWSGQATRVLAMPEFAGDSVGVCSVALNALWVQTAAGVNAIDNFAAWGIRQEGIFFGKYDDHFQINNVTLLGLPGARKGIDTGLSDYTSNVSVSNGDVEGFGEGFAELFATVSSVVGGFWDDAAAFYIPPGEGARSIVFSGNIQFGPHVQTEYYLAPLPNIYNYATSSQNGPAPGFPNNLLEPSQVLLPDGSQLYDPQQANSYVPFTAGPLAGLTTQQLWDDYHLAPNNAVAPADAATDPRTNALVGSAVLNPYFLLESAVAEAAGSSYTVHWRALDGSATGTGDTSTLALGLNLVEATIDGQTYGWLVDAHG